MADAGKKILQGQALQDYLSRCQNYWYDYKEYEEHSDEPHPSGVGLEDRRAALVEQLQALYVIPQTADELERLYWLWTDLGAVREALDLLKTHQEAVVSAQSDNFEHSQLRFRLAFCELDALWQLDREAGLSRLEQVCQALLAQPEPIEDNSKGQLYHFWRRLEHWSLQWQCWAVYQHSLREQYRLRRKIPSLCASLRINEAVDTLLDYALYASHGQDKAALKRYLDDIIEQMQQAGAEIGHEQWMQLCRELLSLNPMYIPSALHACEIQLKRSEIPPAHPAEWTVRQVLAARWQAYASATQGKVTDALQWAEQGHFKLTNDDDYDHFGNQRLEWLLQLGRLNEAAELALTCFLEHRRPLILKVWKLALEQVEQSSSLPHWYWILSYGQINKDLQEDENLSDYPAPQEASYYLEQAQRLAPTHPMNSLLLGHYFAKTNDWQEALPRLEYAASTLPQQRNSRLISLLWVARFLQLTDKQLAKCSITPCEGGDWCLDVGLALRSEDGLLAQYCTVPHFQNSYELRRHFARQYYEMGLSRYQAFFKTGRGGYADAGLLGYSATCNNLGALWRELGKLKKARKLHQQGQPCYPLALHQSNLFHCAYALQDQRELLEAAEQLWFHVLEKGFEYHAYNLANYAYATAWALSEQGRCQEISLWLERLQYCEETRQSHPDEQRLCRGDYLHALMAFLVFHAVNDKAQTNDLLRAHLPEIQALTLEQSGNQPLALTLRYCARLLEYCRVEPVDIQLAKLLYSQALNHMPAHEYIESKRAKQGLARCSKQWRKLNAQQT